MWTGVPDGRQHPDGGMDRDLVEAAQRGDQAAFVDLVRLAWRPPLRDRAPDPPGCRPGRGRSAGRAGDRLARPAEPPRSGPVRRLAPPRPHQRLHRQATRERRRIAHLRVLPVDGPSRPRRSAQRGRSRPARPRLPAAHAGRTRRPRAAPLRGLSRPSEIAELLGVPGGDGSLATSPCPSRHARRTRCRGARVDRRRLPVNERSEIERVLEHLVR